MAIFLEEKSIFFENKVNSKEGYKQLKRYAEHLDKLETDKKCLVYITKNHESKTKSKIFEKCKTNIEFVHIRWYQIFNFLKKYNQHLEH